MTSDSPSQNIYRRGRKFVLNIIVLYLFQIMLVITEMSLTCSVFCSSQDQLTEFINFKST